MQRTSTGLLAFAGLLLIGACGGGNSDGAVSVINGPPTISVAGDLLVFGNGQAQTTVTISDDTTALEKLSIGVESDAPTIVPANTVVVTGSGDSRAVQVSPMADALGSATITLTVTDEAGLVGTTSFTVTVSLAQTSVADFVRSAFAQSIDDAPVLINTLEFVNDADGEDFSDLLE